MPSDDPLLERCGPWALVAGASEGLGAAFARALARRGFDLVIVARRAELLETLATELAGRHGVQVRPLVLDLADDRLLDLLAERLGDIEVGLLVYNAAFAPIGRFVERPLDDHLQSLRVNCGAPMTLAHHFGGEMARRGRGGIVLMSSLSGFQGSAMVAHYAATKAYNMVLAEGLWDELNDAGVSVLACCAGVTRTPAYLASTPHKRAPLGEMSAEAVVEQTLDALARGEGPLVVPGALNRASSWVLRHLLPRRVATRLVGRNTRAMYDGSR